MIGWVTILSMIVDDLHLAEIDPEYHLLISLFIQACLLIELERTRAFSYENRDSIRAGLKFELVPRCSGMGFVVIPGFTGAIRPRGRA